MPFPVSVIVMIAVHIGIKIQSTAEQSLYRIVRAAADTAVKLNARFCKRPLRAAADSAANKDINLQRLQNSGQSAVSAAVGIKNLAGHNFVFLYLINLELFRVAEVLKYFSVFISYCDSHPVFSFFFLIDLGDLLFTAAVFWAGTIPAIAQAVIAAFDLQRQAVNKHIGKLSSGGFIYLLRGGSCNPQPFAALLLGQPLFIDKPDHLKLVYRQNNLLSILCILRVELECFRKTTDPAAFCRSGHCYHPFFY